MGIGGVVLRFCSLAIRVLQFLASAVILGIFSYYLAILARHDLHIATWLKAVEGLAGAGTLYGLLGIIFVCCLGGVSFFAFLGVVLDVCFTGAMIAIAVLTRKGVDQCTGTVDTPLGTGNASDDSQANLSFGMACKLEKVTFAVAIIGVFLFLISILFQILLARHHKREKRFGPSPANGYTSGSRRRWWRRNKASADTGADALPGHPTPSDVEMDGEPKNEKNWFGSWGRKNNTTAPAANGSGAVQNGYGYGNSAYTGNI
ncbi:hypothetical protein N7532_004933 [Penicillium argentinense]|uniref:MARVEL domain-containing protein n=1 Tax=Penicillium argentinense TaxID=1131581 RepID=A0A9W9FD21_9EURO|nr:uncharacterized protein N7532_004933 [Penicillium argentinense]KAJ5097932.1 hypothetical protein N7532_004933 [Penicillium argentinense]